MIFKSLRIFDWQQFSKIEINFDKRLVIITGTNGSGKTTLLTQLARHCSWSTTSLAVPTKNSKGSFDFFARFLRSTNDREIGEIIYSNNASTKLLLPESNAAQYLVQMPSMQGVECFFIPSHRSVYRYEQIANIPLHQQTKENAFSTINQLSINRYQGGQTQSATYFIKNTLIAWNIFGYGNPDMPADAKQLEFFKGFENALRLMLPATLGFKKLTIRSHEVVLECDSGDFMIDAASGGVSTIIDMTWQIYMFTKEEAKEYIVIIDEVENHLHPTMQRRILPDLLNAFPKARFIVSTHSPLIISSSEDASVYALRYKDNKVISELLDPETKSQTATEILDEVLGVSTTIPIWVEMQLAGIVRSFINSELNEDSFQKLRSQLKEIGLEQYMPETLGSLLEQNDKA